MKTVIFLSVLLVLSSFVQAQNVHRNPCEQAYSIIGSMMMGGSSHGVVETFEVGLWGKRNSLGLATGIMLYDGTTVFSGKYKVMNTPLVTEMYIRPTLKLDHNEITGFHHSFNAFVGTKGNYGVSYRAYYQLSNALMMGLEPYISKKNGQGLNFIITAAF